MISPFLSKIEKQKKQILIRFQVKGERRIWHYACEVNFLTNQLHQVNTSFGTATMRLHIISQLIDHYHEFVENYSEDPRYDFPLDECNSNVEDPLGGDEGVTHYDRFNLDQDFYNQG